MARVPTIVEEDAKRLNRERDCLVGERTPIVNRIKSTLARLGVRNFKPTLRKGSERLATVHTPEGMPLPPNTLAEPQRDMARLSLVVARSKRSRTLVRTADSRSGTRKTMMLVMSDARHNLPFLPRRSETACRNENSTQHHSALELAVQHDCRIADPRVALARKLIIALWRFVTTGEPLEGVVLRAAIWWRDAVFEPGT